MKKFVSLLIAFSFGLFLGIILPLQVYLGNSSLYPFSLVRLLGESAILALVLMGAAFIVLWAGSWARGYVHSFFVGVLVCVYLEVAFLSAGLPEINGGFIKELASTSRGVIDLGIWASVIILFVGLTRFIRPYLHFIALAILLMGFASLADVHQDEDVSTDVAMSNSSSLSSGFEWQNDVIRNVRFSSKRNVLMFILDSLPANMAESALDEDLALKAKFTGFTAYSNNVCMHDCTKRGLPGIMTGKYFEPGETSSAEYPMSMYGEDSILVPYVKHGAAVSFSPDLMPYGYTNSKVTERQVVAGEQKRGWTALLKRSLEVPYLSVLDVVVFKFVPFIAKAPFLYSKIRHDPMFEMAESVFWHEHVMYPILASSPVDDAAPLSLGVFHGWGAHPPLKFDLEGNRIDGDAMGVVPSIKLEIRNALIHLSRLIDALKARGLYDQSMIIVTADHGLDFAPCADNAPPSKSAVLWVKPEKAVGAFSPNPLKTSHVKIAPLVRAAINHPLTIDEINKILYTEHRLYRNQDKSTGTGYRDWWID